MPGGLVIQHLISYDNKAQQQSRVPFAHGTKAERQARQEAYMRSTHSIPKDRTATERENLQCGHRERVAIIVWCVMRPDAWVMIITTCVGGCIARRRALALATSYASHSHYTCSLGYESCFHPSRFPKQRVRNAPIASCKTIQWMAPIQAY
jgi:hypothetical protein